MENLILVIEDEPALLELLRFNLTESGYSVLTAPSGAEGLLLARKSVPTLILLDLRLPDLDGLEVCRQLKTDNATRQIPILILTARGEESDRVAGFERGADDYVIKPFSPRELMLRIKAILHRTERDKLKRVFKFRGLEVDPDKPQVSCRGRMIMTTPIEMKLLEYLYRTRGRVQSREILLTQVWGYQGNISTRTVDVHIKRLRQKLGDDGSLIETVRGLGYRFPEES